MYVHIDRTRYKDSSDKHVRNKLLFQIKILTHTQNKHIESVNKYL
jgi:hypothetical protein